MQENILDKQFMMNWDQLFWPVNVLMADITDLKDYHDRTQDFFAKWLCRWGHVPRQSRTALHYMAVRRHTADCAMHAYSVFILCL